MNDIILYSLALALFAGLMMTRVIKPFGLPAVTGYLIAGVLIGPFCLGALGFTGVFVSHENLQHTAAFVQDVALGFIAFAIGSEFKLSSLKQIGKQAAVVGSLQAIITTILVDAVLIALHFVLGEDVLPLSAAITLGAVASATAPAATLMVVKQYKAKGPLTDLLLPVVALDDAVGLILFAISIGVAQALKTPETVGIVSLLVNPLLEVVCSIALGAAMGFVFNFIETFFKSNSKRLCISITFVLVTIAICLQKFTLPGGVEITFSSLLSCMMLGTVFCNICDNAEELMAKTDRWTMPVLVLFFVMSGAELDFSIFQNLAVVGIGFAYVFSRAAGKYFGAWFSGKISHCPPATVKYLGITLFPQAGVAIGMALTASRLLPSGAFIQSIVLFGVLIYELFGPMLTKIALTKAGDIVPKEQTKKD